MHARCWLSPPLVKAVDPIFFNLAVHGGEAYHGKTEQSKTGVRKIADAPRF
jgi:hypothetical protein